MEFNPNTLPYKTLYKLMIGSIVPRPIAWISSLNQTGQPNLAPFSYFNAVCPNPPTLLFCPSIRGTDAKTKDTLNNVRATGEFVVNIVTEAVAEQMNITATEFPGEVNEFDAAGLTQVPSRLVRPPRVGESPIQFECKLHQIIDINDEPGGGSVVLGRIVHIHVREDVLLGKDKIDLEKLKPIGRLGGNSYCRVTDLFEMKRPPSQVTSKST